MKADQNKYPVFEANQVLTNAHLNQVFNYLDEQDRLTRANLIGIGIVCGLEATYDSAVPNIKISMGCGIPSEGYLILLPQEVTLVSYKEYILPDDIAYSPFTFQTGTPVQTEQYDLWEMFEVGEPDATLFTTGFLSTKVILLFLELKKDGLRNCSPNNCDDKGEEVTITLRKLLIEKAAADKIIIEANNLQVGLSQADIAAIFSEKMNLPDLRLPRYNVLKSSLSSSVEVYNSFIQMIKKESLAAAMTSALSAAYTAFKPLLEKEYPSDPFAGFNNSFGFLDSTPTNTTQVKFLQYYCDFFDDLIKAYEEFRWAGIELTCTCCPSEDLFPRHLMVGEVVPSANAFLYRHTFIPSPASCCDCAKETEALLLLFRRLVDLTLKFTNTPPLPAASTSLPDPQIRITPSKLADVPVSDKCIPYYYLQNGIPPLYQSWNPEKTRRGKAKQNLSYRADEYATANFVRKPLEYDIEPYNFLRIEGHLGKNYINALQSLITLRQQNRLPFEIIALRTGAFDETMTVDLSKEECRFQDLETLYSTLRENLRCFICKEMQFFYALPYQTHTSAGTPYPPEEPLLKECATDFMVQPQTLGDHFEKAYTRNRLAAYKDPDEIDLVTTIDEQEGSTSNFVLRFIIYYLSHVARVLPEELTELKFEDLENRYLDLQKVAVAIEKYYEEAIPNLEGTSQILAWEEIDDRLEDILFGCCLDPFKALVAEYADRILKVKKKMFLNFFLINNPGIQHKAGVPLGGTFILVYHQNARKIRTEESIGTSDLTMEHAIMVSMRKSEPEFSKKMMINATDFASEDSAQFGERMERIMSNPEYGSDQDIQYVLKLYREGLISADVGSEADTGLSDLQKIIRIAVKELVDGTVIADFYLPYICCSDCAPIQFVLPKTPPVFTTSMGCSNEDDVAQITVTPEGGVAPYWIKVGDDDYIALTTNTLQLSSGEYTLTIKDDEGTESDPKTITVPTVITFGAETYVDDPVNKKWQVVIPISGGTSPYSVTGGIGTISGSTFTSNANPSGDTLNVQILDSVECKSILKSYTHVIEVPCDLPCDGIANKCGYRFWMPISTQVKSYKSYTPRIKEFSFIDPSGNKIDLAEKVTDIIKLGNNVQILNTDFNGTVESWIKQINELIHAATGSSDWLILTYEQKEGDLFGILWIEYFVCLEFRFDFTIIYSKPEMQEVLNTIYTKDGTLVIFSNQTTGGQQEAKFDLFNCIQINKCDPNKPIKNLFKEPDSKLEITKKITEKKVSFEAKPISGDKPSRFFWEFENGSPAISNEKAPTVNYENTTQKINAVQLTTFSKNGGRVVITDSVSFSGVRSGRKITPKGTKVKPIEKAPIKTKKKSTGKPKKKISIKKVSKSKPATKSTAKGRGGKIK